MAQLRPATDGALCPGFRGAERATYGNQGRGHRRAAKHLTDGDPLQQLILNRTKAADRTVTEHWQIDWPRCRSAPSRQNGSGGAPAPPGLRNGENALSTRGGANVLAAARAADKLLKAAGYDTSGGACAEP